MRYVSVIKNDRYEIGDILLYMFTKYKIETALLASKYVCVLACLLGQSAYLRVSVFEYFPVCRGCRRVVVGISQSMVRGGNHTTGFVSDITYCVSSPVHGLRSLRHSSYLLSCPTVIIVEVSRSV